MNLSLPCASGRSSWGGKRIWQVWCSTCSRDGRRGVGASPPRENGMPATYRRRTRAMRTGAQPDAGRFLPGPDMLRGLSADKVTCLRITSP